MRLLVVEDDRLLNNTLCYNLSTAGYTVDAAMTKATAISFCETQDYDLIVLDVNLPDGNGFDFCEQIKERRPDTAVIFLTANDMESDMLNGAAPPPQVCEEESLFYKINHRLLRLYEVMRENQESVAKDRADLQELISDISHQVKTPIANLQMVNATLLEQSMSEEK